MDIFSTRTLAGVIEEAGTDGRETSWLRDTFFSTVKKFNTETIEFDVRGKGDRKILPFVNPRVGGVPVADKGYSTQIYKAPEVAPFIPTEAEKLLKKLAGENQVDGLSPEERAGEKLAEDLLELDGKITLTEEHMCAQALFEGKVVVKGEGVDDQISYWSHLESEEQPKTTLLTKWDAKETTAQKISADIRAVREAMIRQGGLAPDMMLCGRDVINTIIDKFGESKLLDSRRVDMGVIKPEHMPSGVIYWGRLRDSGIDLYTYDAFYENESGKVVSMVPEKLALMISSRAKTMMAYGVCAYADVEANDLKFSAEPRVPFSWVEKNPDARYVQIKSRPLPVVQQIAGFHVIDALNA